MKKIGMLMLLLSLVACTNKEVKMTDPELQMQGVELHYKGEPFTGTVIQQVPLMNSEFRIDYKDGIPTLPSVREN